MGNEKKESKGELTLEDLKQQEQLILAREEELEARELDLKQRELDLKQREEDLKAQKEVLDGRERILDAKEDKLKEKKQPQLKPGHKFTFRDVEYKFSDDAPRSIRVLGEVMTQEDIAKDEDAIISLLAVNTSLIYKI